MIPTLHNPADAMLLSLFIREGRRLGKRGDFVRSHSHLWHMGFMHGLSGGDGVPRAADRRPKTFEEPCHLPPGSPQALMAWPCPLCHFLPALQLLLAVLRYTRPHPLQRPGLCPFTRLNPRCARRAQSRWWMCSRVNGRGLGVEDLGPEAGEAALRWTPCAPGSNVLSSHPQRRSRTQCLER